MVGVKVAEFCVYSRDDGGLTSVLDSLPKMTGHKSFMMMMVVMVRMTMMMTMMIMIPDYHDPHLVVVPLPKNFMSPPSIISQKQRGM